MNRKTQCIIQSALAPDAHEHAGSSAGLLPDLSGNTTIPKASDAALYTALQLLRWNHSLLAQQCNAVICPFISQSQIALICAFTQGTVEVMNADCRQSRHSSSRCSEARRTGCLVTCISVYTIALKSRGPFSVDSTLCRTCTAIFVAIESRQAEAPLTFLH